jgi:hypothetical protein
MGCFLDAGPSWQQFLMLKKKSPNKKLSIRFVLKKAINPFD